MQPTGQVSYAALTKDITEEWKLEVINLFHCLDPDNEGSITRDLAIHAMSLFGMKGEDHFHFSKKMISVKTFLDAVQDERDRNSDANRRWKYIFQLIAGPGEPTITRDRLREFFTMFGHTPDEKFCDDFIDEFDRNMIEKTEISLEDWLTFCRVHRLPF